MSFALSKMISYASCSGSVVDNGLNWLLVGMGDDVLAGGSFGDFLLCMDHLLVASKWLVI